MKTESKKGFVIFSVLFYTICVVCMVLGSLFDVEIGKAVFDPQNRIAHIFESFGLVFYWTMWGPAFTVIMLNRHTFCELCEFAEQHSITKHPVRIKSEKVMKTLDTLVTAVYNVALFVLSVIGWKKVIENVAKNVLLELGKENLSQAVYFVVSTVAAVAALLIFSRLSKETLKKLELCAFAAVVFGCFLKIVEELKPVTQRVRFREMVAYSNGFVKENGMSEGKYSPLTSDMVNNTDFSAFTPWYKMGHDRGIYSRADSFPSGHTFDAAVLLLTYFLCQSFEKLKKAAPFMLFLSGAYVLCMGFMRMVAGAHYLTDVAAGAIVGYTVFLFINVMYGAVYRMYNK